MAEPERVVLCLMGPTASGKTEVALELAGRRRAALISVDSAMVYRGMDIGTAKPDAATLAQFPHALIDIRDPEDGYSVAAFIHDAETAVEAAFRAGRMPVLVGGTMLYFKALLEGFADLPQSVPALRAQLAAQAERNGLAAMHARLAEVDPEAAHRIDPNNRQRLLRALEVYEASGTPISTFWSEQRSRGLAARLDCQVVEVALMPPRRDLHDRIARRFETMLDDGLLDEVEALRRRPGVHADIPAMRAVGYRQVWAHLEGRLSRAELVARAVAATRQLAKRQATWLRGFDGVHVVDPLPNDAAGIALQYLDAVAIVP